MRKRDFRRTRLWAATMYPLRILGPLLPRWIYSHLWFQGPFHIHLMDAHFRMNHDGAFIENELFWRGSFRREHLVVSTIAARMPNLDVFIDVGANTGLYSLLAHALNPAALVFAIEPSVVNYERLSTNIALNGFEVRAINAAATSEDEWVNLYDFDGFSYSASLVPGFRAGTTARRVRGIRLDSLADEYELWGTRLLLKIDVEGHEQAVLSGARRLMRQGASAVVELLTSQAVHELSVDFPPDSYVYLFIDERTRTLRNVTSEIRQSHEVPGGNYLLERHPTCSTNSNGF